MSGAVIHIAVPVLALLATGLFPRKKVLLFAPFAWVNDFDFIFNFAGYYLFHNEILAHRAVFHNVFVGLVPFLFTMVLWHGHISRNAGLSGRSFHDKWTAFGDVRWGYATALMAIYLWSHVFLDLFQGGVTLFWPLVNLYIYPRVILWANTKTGEPRVEAVVESGGGAPELSPEYPVILPEQFAILLLALIAIVVAFWYESRHARAAPATDKPE